jgi:signal transduction histidine kinase
MNYRVSSKHKPLKRLQLQPADLSKYQIPLRPSLLPAWYWRIIFAIETGGVALGTWLRPQIQMSQQAITDRLQRLSLRERTRRYGVVLNGWLLRVFETIWRGLVNLGHSGLRISRSRIHAIASWFSLHRVVARQYSGNSPVSRLETYSVDPRSLRLSPSGQQDLRRELSNARARLVEELLAEEEELTRVATRVVRLQSLIRSQEHLLAEMAHSEENPADSGRFLAATADDLVGIGKSSSREELRNIPLFWRN